ncbi:hypothetical protein [Rhizobium leguminosarum]
MKKIWKYIGGGAAGIVVAAAAAFMIHPATRFSVTCTSPCVLPEELKLGGNGGAFVLAAFSMAVQSKRLEVRGVDQCNSGCTLLVDHLHNIKYQDDPSTHALATTWSGVPTELTEKDRTERRSC